MAHGSPTIQKCTICKTYGMMPRFGSYNMKYKCSCERDTHPSTKEEGKELNYTWIGWFGSDSI